jgi:hypothetical protein
MPRPIPKVRKKPRKGPLRDPKYLAWCRAWWCAIYSSNPMALLHDCRLPLDAAHTQNNGMRSKGPDSSCVPLCRKHHHEYDDGRAAFEKKYGVDMKALAAEHYARYLTESGVQS